MGCIHTGCCLRHYSVAMTSDDWIKDMQSRLYWITFMFETVLTEEFSLPASRLKEIQERIPFPRFLKPNTYPFMSSDDEHDDKDGYHDSFYEYHFLSQIAHRILITRTKNSIYYSCETCFPPVPSQSWTQLKSCP